MSAVPADDSKVIAIVRASEQAGAAGRAAEAARLLGEAQALAPDHPMVLNATGVQALRAGDAATARRLLERAVTLEPGHPALWLNLASSLRGLKEQDAELIALDKALALEPRHLLALLQKASLLELTGRPRAAADVSRAALATIPQGTTLPPQLREPVERARRAVGSDSAAMDAALTARLGEVRDRWRGERQDRFDRCLDALLGKRPVYAPQPHMVHFPFLPALEYFDREHFPWLESLERSAGEIRDELVAVLGSGPGGMVPYINYADHLPVDQWRELNRSRRWSAFFFCEEGRQSEENKARCPRTTRILEELPGRFDVPRRGPTAFFSILDAKTHIPPHTGVTNARLTVHLPLILPPACRFRVGGETREWQLGRAWVFDDTIEHEAWNDSDAPRAILIFDVWNPFLTEAERELLRTALAVVADFRDDAPGGRAPANA